MVAPVDVPEGTPYGARGTYWSCNENSQGEGIHTGVDFPAPTGTKMVAARDGTVHYCDHGSAFGWHQFEITPGDGTRDFYAHASKRSVADGAKVKAGDKVGEVGAEGNVTGPHLHFERHTVASGPWSCSVVTNPAPSVNWQPSGGGGGGKDENMPTFIWGTSTDKTKLPAGQWVAVNYEKGNQGVTVGNPGVDVQGPYSATLAVEVDNPDGGTLSVSWVEWDSAAGDAAETSSPDSLGQVGNGVSAKVGSVANGRKLRARVRCGKDATLTKAYLNVVCWP